MTGQKPREIAARVLAQRRPEGEFTETLLERALARAELAPADRGLCHELVLGVVRWQATLDWLITRKAPGRTQKAALQDLLRLGLYQIFWLDRIPPHAAVHETVEQAKRNGFGPQAGFINAVLRNFLREADQTKRELAELRKTQPALGHSHPDWLFERWKVSLGMERARQLLEWNNQPPRTYARLNTLRTVAAKLIEQWRVERVDYDFFSRDWTGENLVFELKAHPSLATLKSFRDGWFYLQDPSTLLAVRELHAQPGEAILDYCAAPGGKTTFLAQLVHNESRIVAHDNSTERLKLVAENCTRLGVTCVTGMATPPSAATHFDRILLDAPCSNTGVMRRRADLRWRIRPEEIARLRATQLELLHQLAPRLKAGGILVYSTCSVEPEENRGLVQEFLAAHGEFRLERERELLPMVDGVDGAFVSRLRRA